MHQIAIKLASRVIPLTVRVFMALFITAGYVIHL